MPFQKTILSCAITHAMWSHWGRVHIPLVIPGMATYGFNRPLYLKM